MAIGQHEYILVGRIHIKGRVMFHDTEIKGGKEFSTAQRPAGVTTAGTMNHSNYISTYLGGDGSKFCHKNLVRIKLFVSCLFLSKIGAANVRSF